MPLVGLHVVVGFAGARGYKDSIQPLMIKRVWSETLEVAGETASEAPREGDVHGQPIFRVRSSVDAWISIKQDPDSSVSPRMFLPREETVDYFSQPGDRLAWEPA